MKERYQNPVIGDDVRLKLLTFNSNCPANVYSFKCVNIYFLDPNEKCESNPDGRRLVQIVQSTDITQISTGEYSITISLNDSQYTIGNYLDVWEFEILQNEPTVFVENQFKIYPNLWFTSPTPIVYDFNFSFRPNRIRKGECRWIIINIIPNVPTASDLVRYYENLAIVSTLKISIEQACGPCIPVEQDLRLIVDGEIVTEREKCVGYYKIDTKEMDCGIYNLWFELNFGGNCYISDKMQLQVM